MTFDHLLPSSPVTFGADRLIGRCISTGDEPCAGNAIAMGTAMVEGVVSCGVSCIAT